MKQSRAIIILKKRFANTNHQIYLPCSCSRCTMAVFLRTCSVIQPRCFTSMPGCMVFISSFTLGKRLAAPAWIPLYQDWAMAGSFARKNTEFFLLDEITSKYLAQEMRGREGEERNGRNKKEVGKRGPVREVKRHMAQREELQGE